MPWCPITRTTLHGRLRARVPFASRISSEQSHACRSWSDLVLDLRRHLTAEAFHASADLNATTNLAYSAPSPSH
jgi:hypothetical protein